MRIAAGPRWIETGYVFTRPNGLPLQPDYLTQRFHLLVQRYDLPPVRLHDLRHGAASLAHSAGADLKTIQDQLGHASIMLTADTYTSVLPPRQYQAADATARLILTAARGLRAKLRHQPPTLVILRPGGPKAPRTGERAAGPSPHNHKKRSKRIKKAQKRARRATAQASHHRGNH